MANIKKIKKELVKLSEEELKEVLEFALVDDEEEETTEETKTEVEKEEVQEEQPKYATLEDIQGLLEKFKEDFVTKEEVEEKEKKAKPFGVKQSPEKPKDDSQKRTTQDYLAMVNQKF